MTIKELIDQLEGFRIHYGDNFPVKLRTDDGMQFGYEHADILVLFNDHRLILVGEATSKEEED